MSRRPNLAALKRAVDRAYLVSRTPPDGATEWPFTLPQDHFTDAEWRELRSMVRFIRNNHPKLHRRFLYETTISYILVEWLKAERRPTYAKMLKELERRAIESDEWLVAVPLVNAVAPASSVPLGTRAMLVSADERRGSDRWDTHPDDSWLQVTRHLGDRLSARGRWMRMSESDGDELDTRHMSTLFLVVRGTEEMAASTAETRARLALAMWCILAPPYEQESVRPLWPAVGGWGPASYLEFGLERKLYQPSRDRFGKTSASVRGRVTSEYSPYQLPSDEQIQRAPFVAIERAEAGNHCALALLSAARSLYLAAKFPSDLERTERVIYIQIAKEALSYRGRAGQGDDEDRWIRAFDRLGVRSELMKDGWEADEIDEAMTFAGHLRDLTAHRAEDVLVNLDFPASLSVQLRQHQLLSDDLALARVAADWGLFLTAVRRVVRKITLEAIAHDWDDRWFHSQFERRPRRAR